MTSDSHLTQAPLTTDQLVHDRVASLLETAIRHQFWLLFLDDRSVQTDTVVPVDGIPGRPHPELDAEHVARMVAWLADAEGADSVVFVIERPGDDRLTVDDIAWARVLRRGGLSAGVGVRAILLLHDGGARWVAPDDYLF